MAVFVERWWLLIALVACNDTTELEPLPAGQCRAAADCVGAEACLRPDAVVCDGECPPDACSGDSDCQNNGETDVCTSVAGARQCVAACDASGCPDHESCGVDGRCVAKTCTIASDCPANFSCAGDTCFRTGCEGDGACVGFCVLGECYAEAGTCAAPSS